MCAIPLILVLAVGGYFIFKSSMKSKLNSDNLTKTLPTVNFAEGRIIDGFPEFPIYPNATILSSQIERDTPTSYQAYLESADAVAAIVTWYNENLVKDNWTIVRSIDPSTPADQNVLASKNGLNLTVNVEKESDGTKISIDIR